VFEDELFALFLGHGFGLIVISRCRQFFSLCRRGLR
jgi:hypothetical protein